MDYAVYTRHYTLYITQKISVFLKSPLLLAYFLND